MSEYKREATFATVAAIAVVIVLASAIMYLPLGLGQSPESSSLTQTVSTGESSGVSYTRTIATESSTIPYAQTYTNVTIPLDSQLTVTPVKGLLETSQNATAIAEALALDFNELPIHLASHQEATCGTNSTSCRELYYPYSTAIDYYLYKSSKGSNITVDLASGRFLELQYAVDNYYTLHNGYWNNRTTGAPNSNSSEAVVAVSNLMLSAFGIDLSRVSLAESVALGFVQWSQQYHGVSIANSGSIFFEYYPPTSQIIWLVISDYLGWELHPPSNSSTISQFVDNFGGWNLIPSSFPLNINSSTALNDAKEFAINTIHLAPIAYASISFQMVEGRLYYAATISNQSVTYLLFVNPATGQVGYPNQ